MKNIFTLLFAFFFTGSLFAQAPEKMSYQAVVRDGSNELVINQSVGMQISILQGTVSGTSVYTETQTPTTNSNGLVSLEIGSGTSVSGTFSAIDWSAGPYFIKTETDPNGGINYTITGTSQLMSVPYALYAKRSGNGEGPQGPAGVDGNDGATGATGSQGAQGIQGLKGDDGATGPQGPIGNDGADGIGGVTSAGTGIIVAGAGTVGSPYIVSATSACVLSIGDTHQGGIIFYLDGSGCHGLVAKATDEPGSYKWSATGFITWAHANGIYGGAQNTKKSIARAVVNGSACPAASACDNLTSGGYTDWYLPSKGELDMMYVNLQLQGLGGFANSRYWSSTEHDDYDDYDAWSQDFSNGNQSNGWKNLANDVRAVRAF